MNDPLVSPREGGASRPRIPITQLDAFLRDVYSHYCMKGLVNVVLSGVLNLVMLSFLAALGTFVVHFVNYGYLFGRNDGPLVIPHPWASSRPGGLVITIWVLLALAFVVQILSLVGSIRTHREVAKFYSACLGISQSDLEHVRWSEVVDRISRTEGLARAPLSQLDVVSRITRRENYMIAMINRDVLDLRLPFLPSFLGGGAPLVSESVEWALWFSVFSVNFGPEGIANEHMDASQWSQALRRRFITVGIGAALISPFVCLYLVVYMAMRYGEQLRTDPSSLLGGRKWSPMARWRLRELNEVHHIFGLRLRRAHESATFYVSQFPSSAEVISVARFLVFVLGAALMTLLVFSFISTRFVFTLWGLSSVFYITALTAAIGACRSLLPPESLAYEYEKPLRAVAKHTHFMPNSWRGNAHSKEVFGEFSTLFQFKLVLWLREFISVFLMPLVFIVSLPRCADGVVDFFKQFTTYSPGVGSVCSYATLLDPRFGDASYGSSENAPVRMRLRDGKMEKSFLSFFVNYPNWEVPQEGQALLRRLREFERRKKESEASERSQMFGTVAFANFGSESAMAGMNMAAWPRATGDGERAQVDEALAEAHLDFSETMIRDRTELETTSAIVELDQQPSPVPVIESDGDGSISGHAAIPSGEAAGSSVISNVQPVPATSVPTEPTAAGVRVTKKDSYDSDISAETASLAFHLASPDLPFVTEPKH